MLEGGVHTLMGCLAVNVSFIKDYIPITFIFMKLLLTSDLNPNYHGGQKASYMILLGDF